MNQTTYKINTDIVSTTMKDKPLIYISEEAINLKRDNDNLKSIIKEAREYIKENMKIVSKEQAEDTRLPVGTFMWNVDKVLEILDKEKE